MMLAEDLDETSGYCVDDMGVEVRNRRRLIHAARG